MKHKWLALFTHIVFLAPISVILAFAFLFQLLYLLIIDKFNHPLSLLLYLALSFYFVYMSILTIDTMFRLMHEVIDDGKDKEM